MIESWVRFQRSPLSADAVGEILRQLLELLIEVRDLIAVINSHEDISARDHAILHRRQALHQFLNLPHSPLAFSPAHRDDRERPVAFWLADGDRQVDLVFRQYYGVIPRRVRSSAGLR